MPTSPIKRSKSKRNQQTIQQRTHQEEHETTEEMTKKAKNVVAKSLKFSEFFRERS